LSLKLSDTRVYEPAGAGARFDFEEQGYELL